MAEDFDLPDLSSLPELQEQYGGSSKVRSSQVSEEELSKEAIAVTFQEPTLPDDDEYYYEEEEETDATVPLENPEADKELLSDEEYYAYEEELDDAPPTEVEASAEADFEDDEDDYYYEDIEEEAEASKDESYTKEEPGEGAEESSVDAQLDEIAFDDDWELDDSDEEEAPEESEDFSAEAFPENADNLDEWALILDDDDTDEPAATPSQTAVASASADDSDYYALEDELEEDAEEDEEDDWGFTDISEEDEEDGPFATSVGFTEAAEDSTVELLSDDEELEEEAVEAPEASLLHDEEDEEISENGEEETEADQEEASEEREEPAQESKFAALKRKALAELKGEEPEEATPSKKKASTKKTEATEEEPATEKPKKPAKGAHKMILPKLSTPKLSGIKILLKPLYLLKSLYLAIVNFFFQALEAILKILSKLPLVGRPFRWLLTMTQILRIIATCIPLLILIAIFIFVNKKELPFNAGVQLPDEGAAIVETVVYNEANNTVVVTVKNTGAIIAEVTPTAHLYSGTLTDPTSWITPKAKIDCRGTLGRVEIDKSKTFIIQCADKAPGFNVQARASLE